MQEPPESVTQLLNNASHGDDDARRVVYPYLCAELRRLACARMAKLPPGQTLQPTALVHEAYIRIHEKGPLTYDGRAHFFFVAARAIRDVLVEDARRKSAGKRGGGQLRVTLGAADRAVETPFEDVLLLDAALRKLEAEDPAGHQIVLLRYFTGLTVKEVAATLGTSVSTVERKWRFLKSWLAHELTDEASPGGRGDERG